MTQSASSNESFKDFVLDQLDPRLALVCRPMFGGYGLYGDGGFFGIVHQGRLYFKTDEQTRRAYITEGAAFFQPNPTQALKNYYEVPVAVLEDRDRLSRWAKDAIAVSLSQQGS